MSNAFAFGQYVPGSSPVHELNAQVKIILTCVFSICVFFVSTWAGLLLCCAVLAGLYDAASLPLRKALLGIKPLGLLLAFTVLAQTFTCDVSAALKAGGTVEAARSFWGEGLLGTLLCGPNDSSASLGSLGLPWCIALAGNFGITVDGFARGMFFALRIALLLAACCLMSFTTSNMAIVSALGSLLKPLRGLHVPVDDLCLVISIALRFVPTVTQEAYAIKRAQEARGALFEGRGFVTAIKAWAAVLTPLVVRLFKRADNLALAMEARCYSGKRSPWHDTHMSPRDVRVLAIGLVLMLLITIML